MNLLVFDTSTERAVIALSTASGGPFVTTTDSGRRHGRDLIPQVSSLLSRAGLRVGNLDLVAVGLGPGSYTGLRVGVTAAKTLAYATGAALAGLDSLQAIGRNAPAEALRVSVIADAQRGDLYVADLARPAPGAPLLALGESRIEPLANWGARMEQGVLVLGPGLDSPRIRGALPAGLNTMEGTANYPQGVCLIELAREAQASGRLEVPWLLEPRYLRRSAAEDQWDALHRP
jgi:tRNA threonylcarbamoyladenosine biosynthesis protein TsaB